MIDVSICVCTFRRPAVAETIRTVGSQDCFSRVSAELIVCDDDPAESARAVVEKARTAVPIPVRYIVSAAGNVSKARNACLDAASGEFVAFVDDDETVDVDWLSKLLAVREQYSADAVKGAIRGVYPDTTPAWVRAADPYSRDYGVTGRLVTRYATGNVLFRRSVAATHGLRFDPAYGRSGGEDVKFFEGYVAVGGTIVASRDAVVNEIVPPDRVTPGYLRRRSIREGEVEGRRAVEDRSVLRRVPKRILFFSLFWTYPLTRPLGGRVYHRTRARFYYSVGFLRGIRGRDREEMI